MRLGSRALGRLRLGRAPRVLDAPAAYALWAPAYPPHAHNPLMAAEQRAMERCLAGIAASRALDVGTGSGRYLAPLRGTGASTVVGLDLSPAMLERAAAALPASRASLVRADAMRLPFADASFDLVTAGLVVGDLSDLDGWAREAARVLRPGGHLLWSDVHPVGAASGWRRTFRTADGRAYAVRHHRRSIAEHVAALEHRGFTVASVDEAGLDGQSGPEIDAFRERWGEAPVALVVHAIKARRARPAA